MAFPVDTDFCCLALKGPRLQVKQEHIVLPGLTISNAQNEFELEPHWAEWLGSIQANSFRESSLYITAFSQSSYNTGNRPVNEFLDKRVRLLHHTLVLLGCGYNDATLMVGGSTPGGGLHIGPVRPGLTPHRPYYRRHRRVEMNDIERAKVMLVFGAHL